MTNSKKAEKGQFKDKLKSSYYLLNDTEAMISEIYVNRLKRGERPRKSSIVDEAIALLYKAEFNKN
jgi:hypothetical protein